MIFSEVSFHRRLPWFVKWGAVAIVVFIYSGLFGEVFMRIFDPQLRMPRYVTGTEYGIRGNIPNSIYRQVTPEADVEMRINAQGMRSDRDYTMKKPSGTCRIALLGDSYFMGYEAHFEDTIGALLEVRLADLGYNVEVLNFAVSGFSTEEMLREFDARVVLYDPDIVISQFGEGDFHDNMRPGLYQLDETGAPQPTGGSYLPGVAIRDTLMKSGFYRMLINHSHFYSAVREAASRSMKSALTLIGGFRKRAVGIPDAPAKLAEIPSEGDTQTLSAYDVKTRYTSALLTLSREKAEALGMEWFMFEVPAPVPIFEKYLSAVKDLDLDAASQERIITPVAYFDSYERKEGDPWFYRVKGHAHFSETGHDLSTQALIDGMFNKTPYVFNSCRS